jgi:hypothetical protein
MKTNLNKVFFLSSIFIPLALIVLSLLFVYLPNLIANPEYDYIFSVQDTCTNCMEGQEYIVEAKVDLDGKVQFVKSSYVTTDPYYRDTFTVAKFYRYDAQTDTFDEVTTSDIENFSLSGKAESPDGFQFRQRYLESFFDGTSDYEYVLEGKGTKLTQNLDEFDNYEYRLDFVGWILND